MSPQIRLAIEAVEAAVGSAPNVGADIVDSTDDAVELLRAAERLVRLATVARVDAIAAVDTSRVYIEHGHSSAAKMSGHLGRWSAAETGRADKIRRMTTACDAIDTAWRAGELSVDQAAVLGRAFSNPRVRDAFIESQHWFLGWAHKSFPVFERRVADWVRLTDMDGPTPRPEPAHQNRDTWLAQDHFSQAWVLRGSFGSLQGAELARIFAAYLSAETLRDYDIARETHGPDASDLHLPRTVAQRRADALHQIFVDAIHNPNRSTPVERVHNIVWSESTLESMMARHFGAADVPAPPIDVDSHRCHSLAGHPYHLDAAFADFMISSWRKVVTNTTGTCLSISTKQRFYTGLARLGVMITHQECFWPGCHIPATACEIDHRKPAARGGQTTQQNGAPACHKHNRLKERGYTVTITCDDGIQTRTPTGELIPA